jgi:hypothetical protein
VDGQIAVIFVGKIVPMMFTLAGKGRQLYWRQVERTISQVEQNYNQKMLSSLFSGYTTL